MTNIIWKEVVEAAVAVLEENGYGSVVTPEIGGGGEELKFIH